MIAILPIALSPGASFTLAISSVPVMGMKGAIKVIVGTSIGIVTHALLVGLGVSALLIKYQYAMMALKVFGVLFLLWLGLKLISTGIQAFISKKDIQARSTSVKEALLLNIFNVKAMLLYLTVVPSFAGEVLTNYLLLACIHIAIMSLWVLCCSGFIMYVQSRFNLTIITSVINSIGGLFLLYVAVSLGFVECILVSGMNLEVWFVVL